MGGCEEEFVTSNYGVRTTPRKEYEIATGARECPAEDRKDTRGREVRRVRRLEELEGEEAAQRAGLERIEIPAVVRGAGARRAAPPPCLH